jgi:hypothetical protein
MSSRSRLAVLALSLGVLLVPSVAWSQGAALDDDAAATTTDPTVTDPSTGVVAEEARFGVGIRLRNVRMPRGLIELFVERAATGTSNFGFGLELIRRKGDFEFQVGFEYESIDGDSGIWIDKGESIPQDDVDFVEFKNFGWFTFEVTFLNHTKLAKQVALRYGGGAGLGIFKGSVNYTDYMCTTSSTDSCNPLPGGETNQEYDIPPVFPVINAIIGLQFRPVENLVVNVEAGIRTALFFGTGISYYF